MDLEAESSARFREEEKRWVLISDPQIRMASESLEGWVTRCQSPKSGNKNFKKPRTFSQQCWEGVEKRFGCASVSNLVIHSALVGGLDQGILPVPTGAFRIFFASETLFRMRYTCGNVRE